LFGGEPLCHPDFPLFLKYSQLYNYSPTLTTNGDFLAKYSELISKSSLMQLNISINGLIEDNGIINSKFAEIIKIFIYQNRKKKIINLNYLIVPETYRYLGDIIAHFNDHYAKDDFAYFTIQHLNMIEKDDIGTGGFNLKELADIIASIKKLRLKFKLLFLPNIKLHDIEKYYSSEGVFGNRCFVPWVGLTIYPDLTVTPGGTALGCNFVLGNLLKESVTDIWRGDRLRDFRLSLIKKGLPEICNRCCQKLYY
jgi:MoaA/NifB/PqqE/SkfB family radical SAM enzyme